MLSTTVARVPNDNLAIHATGNDLMTTLGTKCQRSAQIGVFGTQRSKERVTNRFEQLDLTTVVAGGNAIAFGMNHNAINFVGILRNNCDGLLQHDLWASQDEQKCLMRKNNCNPELNSRKRNALKEKST